MALHGEFIWVWNDPLLHGSSLPEPMVTQISVAHVFAVTASENVHTVLFWHPGAIAITKIGHSLGGEPFTPTLINQARHPIHRTLRQGYLSSRRASLEIEKQCRARLFHQTSVLVNCGCQHDNIELSLRGQGDKTASSMIDRDYTCLMLAWWSVWKTLAKQISEAACAKILHEGQSD
ncbi:hypothetical protein ASPBRDRAFT_29168 [Aspergillus brasiliensis CBS 101740]|uniref:Uncharacterized protein n=1 Tax=Aspergillus brasiliensis (strain CBS 101740 / IMI 381727 / IBT 21946) TaxID=767769 RepID=A0A1L9UQP9_ASPBC|nr:hypothetical protein ASPBRDRAFT_29168 [Aspergillus brasiliensis CBS 101740]